LFKFLKTFFVLFPGDGYKALEIAGLIALIYFNGNNIQ